VTTFSFFFTISGADDVGPGDAAVAVVISKKKKEHPSFLPFLAPVVKKSTASTSTMQQQPQPQQQYNSGMNYYG